MSELSKKMEQCEGRNQARMVLKAHCDNLNMCYRDYTMTPEESAVYFSKGPYSPFHNKFNALNHVKKEKGKQGKGKGKGKQGKAK